MRMLSMLTRLAGRALPGPLLFRLRLFNAIRKARRSRVRAGPFCAIRNALARPLIVSLTSFEPRFSTLHLTIESLLDQTVTPDEIILWITQDEVPRLPEPVIALQARGLKIRGCEDIKSYKKLIYALSEYPDCYIATADDDVFYEPGWLQTLIEGLEPADRVIVCHRAHRLVMQTDGKIAPYLSWQLNVHDHAARIPSRDILPVGVGGILYPPNCFSPEVTDRGLFEQLSPTADDLWFYWMARKVDCKHKKVGEANRPFIFWPTAAVSSLMSANWTGGNDRQVRNLEAAFGNPISG